jgi:hypothetical protein
MRRSQNDMNSRNHWLWPHTAGVSALILVLGVGWAARFLTAQAADSTPVTLGRSFEQQINPFLKQNCVRCHNTETAMSGVRVDQLDAVLEDRHLPLWEGLRRKISDGTMPPKGQPQPNTEERQRVVEWISRAVEMARLRPTPKNGLVRRLTVAQYRNTLRELLLLDDDLTETLPPDAVSKDGFVNNKETLQLSPLLLEAYFDIAEEALKRAIVDPKSKPAIQNFRVELGESVNPKPFPDPLILGANSLLLDNKDFVVTQLTPTKPFTFEPRFMQTKYRFIEGYAGNDTVRGWREYDSIYHSVFACMRGSTGYPKGQSYGTVPEGLLLRPAIPNDEMFEGDGTYGPKANFKISLRELPDHGRFRVTVMAARYKDGLLLDSGAAAQPDAGPDVLVIDDPKTPQEMTVAKPGIYQVDVHLEELSDQPAAVDSSRLNEGLSGSWPLNGSVPNGNLEGDARLIDSPFDKAVSLDGDGDALVVARSYAMNVGEDDFTVAAWIHPQELRRAGIVGLGTLSWSHGWYLDVDGKGSLRIETAGPDSTPNGTVSSPPGVVVANAWQHVAAVVRRRENETRLYVNGFPVAKGQIGPASLDNLKVDLHLGRIPGGPSFRGELDEVRIYRRALDEAEIQGLVEPGRQFAKRPVEKPQDLLLALGARRFSGELEQPAFLAVRLEAGPLPVRAEYAGVRNLERIVLTPLAEDHEIARRFRRFEKRSPRLGVHLGLRRDCGSTFAQVGQPQTVANEKLTRFVFEGAIRNFPSPDVEKDNVNYLAGIREIGVRSEFTDGRDMPRLLIRSVEFEGPFYESWPPKSHRNIFIESAHKNDLPADARQIVRSFATRAYRRPVTAAEESALMAVYQKSSAAGRSFQDRIKDTLQVVLTSPQFLFLIEKSSTPAPEPIDDHELASKLSYFLWNGPPDHRTLQLARKGALRGELDAEVERLIEDARFSRFVQEFGSQWLSLDKFDVLEPDRKLFPRLTRDVRAQLRKEPVQFLQYLIRNNRPARNLIESDFVVGNEVVASYYGVPEKTESGFQFVPIANGGRSPGGVITQPAIMAGLSDGRESNPVKRGAWLARRIIAEPPDDPPPNVPALPEDTQHLTLRERIERHRSQPGCFQCHTKIDPWGVALEEFDAGGRLKQQPVDARSKLPDQTEVLGIKDLQRYLGQDRIDQVAFSVLKHLMTYATGRSLTYYELHYLKRDALKLKPGDYRMKDMIRYVVNNKLFLEK